MAVSISVEDGIGTIVLDKPPANSYDLEYIQELGVAVEEVRSNDAVKVAIVRSASEKFFSAGADIKAFVSGSVAQNMEMIETSHRILSSISTVPKIFIAAINGHALGGGLEIPLACDLRFAAEGEYRLGVPEVTLGLLPGNGGTQRLPRLIGWSRALELMVSGRTLSPREALELGIVNRLFPAEQLQEGTREFASTLAAGATKAIGNIKLAVHRGIDVDLESGLAIERGLAPALFESEDGREGVAAFAEKRPAVFKGA